MKLVGLFIVFFISNTGFSQNRIIYKTADINDTAQNEIKEIRTPWGNHGRFLLVIKNEGSKTKIRKKELWGFQNRKNKTLRFYQGNIYEVVDTSSLIIIYKTYSPKPVYYFSETFESKPFPLWKRKIIKILGADTYLKICRQSNLVRQLQ